MSKEVQGGVGRLGHVRQLTSNTLKYGYWYWLSQRIGWSFRELAHPSLFNDWRDKQSEDWTHPPFSQARFGLQLQKAVVAKCLGFALATKFVEAQQHILRNRQQIVFQTGNHNSINSSISRLPTNELLTSTANTQHPNSFAAPAIRIFESGKFRPLSAWTWNAALDRLPVIKAFHALSIA